MDIEHQQRAGLTHEVRHDLRSHLNKILGYSDLLADDASEQGLDAFVPDLRKINTAGVELLALINAYVDPIDRRVDNAPPGGQRPQAEVQERAAPEAAPMTTGAGLFLVADDDAVNRDLLLRLLRRQGHEGVGVENGRRVLEEVGTQPFDVILLDLMMPEMDGIETLQRLKASAETRHLPVIMISALDDLNSIVRCIEMGAEDYLAKPFDPTLLRARIGASLEKKRLRDREHQLFMQVQDNYTRLQQLERLRDDLTHMIVHDLRTPLTSFLTGLRTVELMGELNADQQEMLEGSIQGGQTLLGMINDLLDVSKMESNSLKLEYDPLTAQRLIQQAVHQVRALTEEKNQTLCIEIPADLPAFEGDEEKLLRTLVNLLSNAIKFTPPDGLITLSAALTGDGASMEFCVRDTGEGIPQEALGRIFDKFGQVETRQAGRKMSTGLGLTFCKLAAEAHGGAIHVESAPGQGSAFQFSVPLERKTSP